MSAPVRTNLKGFEAHNRGKCKVCGVKIAGNRYYCDEHRPANRRKSQSERKDERARANVAGPQGVDARELLSDLADNLNEGKKGPPSLDETSRLLGRVLFYLWLFFVLAIIRGDPAIESEDDKDHVVATLQLNWRDSEAIVHPFARALGEVKIWKSHGRKAIEHSDVIDAAATLYECASELMKYDRAKRARIRGVDVPLGSPVVNVRAVPQQNGSAPGPHLNGEGPPLEPESFDGRQGVLVTREMLRRRMTGEE